MEAKSNTVSLIVRTFKKLRAFAAFDGTAASAVGAGLAAPDRDGRDGRRVPHEIAGGLTLGYTINLNLPATTNIEVFNAIFRSLRENLLSDAE